MAKCSSQSRASRHSGPSSTRSSTSFPVLLGTIRDHDTLRRRPFVRYYACEDDYSHEAPDTPLPAPVADGKEPFLIVGAMAGG